MSSKPWLRHYPAEVPKTYDYPKHNVAEFLVQAAALYPERIALHFLGRKVPYRELLESAYRFANGLKRLGVRHGERVAVMLPNCPQAVIAYYGTLLAGGIVVMTNPLYMPRELEHQLQDSGSRTLVTLDLLFERVMKVVPLTDVRHVVVTSIKDYLPFPKNWLYPLKAKKDGLKRDVVYSDSVLSFLKMLRESPPNPCSMPVDAERDLALIQYTGGTTGTAKGVMLTHYNLTANAIQSRLWAYRSAPAREKYLAALPFFHVFGMTVLMNQSMYLGGTLILLPRFEINQALETIHRHRPTIFPGAPTMYISLIHHPDVKRYDLSSIAFCISGAASLPYEVQTEFERMTGGKLIEGYGLTEASPVTHANNIWEKRKLGSIGIPFPDTESKVVHPDTGEELPAGEIGELIVRGPQVMKGYWNNPAETAAVLKNGWLYTGDLARMDEDGYFYILDRRKDLIIAGGYNIYPREVEEVLFEHPDIAEAVVAGAVDPYRGETVKAYIVLRPGADVDADELKSWCKERLAAYKVPRIYEFRDSLPKTIVGKVLRRKLAEEESERLKEES
ncbi:long-chain acyl-CoA synthetase [Paenibacillus sp. UNCCL117]|uniref:long-chain-fatty-acid--CoA ligase n=1 Tax=unclassified Paenibacillus TaxID=185978 RepID=UPI0008828D44|nr:MULTISPECIES: long-chain fatty acid--CoA ligase [unclassified Paenibacillus]SDC64670.1 long-chain acyl-CoA synthetase [Paenibacillus sp. cl123]SFW22582.1 long-chain acyl-CoA synthetase [Paenibacillus sp. UNCCL117]